jgi:hypothetical protein
MTAWSRHGAFAQSAKSAPNRSLAASEFTSHLPQPTAASHLNEIQGQQIHDPARKNVLVVSHEASRSGAPILSQNAARVLCKHFAVSSGE